MKILIVDDSKAMRSMLEYFVHALHLETALAEDGCDALEVLQNERDVGLALVDWNMPRMDGLQFVQAVRANPMHKNLKLMMVTSQNSMERVATALSAGATDFLMKPVSQEALEEKLRVLGFVP